MDAVFSHFPDHCFAPQLGTSLILGTSNVKKPAILKVLVGAVGIESLAQSLSPAAEPDIANMKPELAFQGAIKREIEEILKCNGSENLRTFFVLESFGLDLAVFLEWADGRVTLKLFELKGQFALSWCGSQTVGGAPDEIFAHIANRRNGCTIAPVF
jgi:hypothetical protein